MNIMPTLFISHGSPTIVIEKSSPARAFLSSLAESLPKPKAILIISAHWETQTPQVTASARPETIHDFYGFPEELFRMTYPADGDPNLARHVGGLIQATPDDTRGLDHGAWSPLSLIYPEANIPTVQLSLQTNREPSYHYDIGLKLQSLRKEGVLIIGSGATTHNLREIERNKTIPDPWAKTFQNWFIQAIENNDHDALLNAKNKAPDFRRAHPTDEHWLPLYIAMGAAQNSATLIHKGFEHKNLSMASVRFD